MILIQFEKINHIKNFNIQILIFNNKYKKLIYVNI